MLCPLFIKLFYFTIILSATNQKKSEVYWKGYDNQRGSIDGIHRAITDELFDIYLPIKNNKNVNKYK